MKPLSLEQFRRLVESYGSNPSRWPDAERPAALALLEGSAEARSLSKSEAALDDLFARCDALELPSELERRLNEVPLRAARKSRWSVRALWAPALGWAAAAVCGVWLGTAFPEEDTAAAKDSPVAAPAAASTEDAVLELAAGSSLDLDGLP
jgi:hypothetical protein